jgi:hypothetical protein
MLGFFVKYAGILWLNMLGFFGPLESPLQELTMVDGASIWAGDGVHLTSNASRVASQKLMQHIATEKLVSVETKFARFGLRIKKTNRNIINLLNNIQRYILLVTVRTV